MNSLFSSKALGWATASLILIHAVAVHGEEQAAPPKLSNLNDAATPSDTISLTDLQGTIHRPMDWKDRTVVLVFIGLECPVANSYAPEVMTQKNAGQDQKTLWLGIHSEPGVSKEAALKHAKEYQLTMPILLDSEQKLAAAVGAKKLGQVVVVQDLQVVYRGRIDDRFAMNGKRRDEPSTHELRDVLAALAAKKPIAVVETEAYGCPIPFKK